MRAVAVHVREKDLADRRSKGLDFPFFAALGVSEVTHGELL
jgi:hypothetical protein